MRDSLTAIPNAIQTRDSLPRPDWVVINAWIESHVASESLDESWTQIARDWLARLARAMPHDYTVYESGEFLVLTANASLGNRILQSAEHARRILLKTLDGVADDQGNGKHVIMLFADIDSYYDYISDFYPNEGEFGLSGGVFLGATEGHFGYGHFAICLALGNDYERVIAHELNHALLRHLPLPLWLDEGVTQVMEDIVLDSSYFMVDQEILRRHRAHWNAKTIDKFWSGESFSVAGDGQELSYHLAQVLFRNLMSDFPKCVKQILNNASWIDAGNGAFINACNQPLARRVSQFLGMGPWTTRSDYAAFDQ